MSISPKSDQYLQTEYQLYLVMDRVSSRSAINMFFYLAHKMTLGGLGRIKISNKTIQKERRLLQPNFSRDLKILKKYNMLMKIPMGYMLNPELVWKGDRSLIPQALVIWYRENKKK